ncbi:MAG: tRNA lysidine(34) synthetase TilS [Polyangia bacterium]
MLSRMLRTIGDHGLFARGDRALVAISGGPDSTALLHGLLTLAPRLGISLQAACVDHGLRPESSDEAETVAQRCHAWGVSATVVKVDVARARRRHVSVQEAARVVRLAGLAATAKELDCNKVALGHTADDQAETVLFRIVRGTGIFGLAGIPYQRESLVRPLLDVRRGELLTYLAKRKLPFISDPSNADRRYARARIRHSVLPMLECENPRVVEALLALAREAQRWRAGEVGVGGGSGDPLWAGRSPSRRAAETVRRLVREGRGSHRVAVSGGEVVVCYGRASWQAAANPETQGEQELRPISPQGGKFRLAGPPALAIEVLTAHGTSVPVGECACFDVARLTWPLWLRARRPGDRMVPRGGRGSRKLSDLLIDAKIPRRERGALPLLCDAAGRILFVPGLRPAEAGRPGEGTREWVEVRVAR